MSLRVKVVKSGFESYWYSDRVGEIFEVEDRGDDFECIGEDVGRCITKEDCEIVNGIISKPGVSGAFTGDNRVDSLRRIQSMCQSDCGDSQELLRFKLNVLHTVIDGLYY